MQKELNSSPQPCLVPFLKKSLPFLQSSLASGELTIEGVRAPPVSSLRLPSAASVSSAQSLAGTGSMGVRSTLPLPRQPASNVIYQTSARPPASVIRSRGQSPVTTTVVRPSFSQSPLPVTQLQNSANRATKTVLRYYSKVIMLRGVTYRIKIVLCIKVYAITLFLNLLN